MRSLVLKLSLLFFSVLVLHTLLHELSHALMAYALHIRSTMFHLFVNPETANASSRDVFLIAVIGPVTSLGLGTFSWILYKRFRGSTMRLTMLYSAAFGVGIFLGNTFSIGFGGDFGTAATAAVLPNPLRYAVSGLGGIAWIWFMSYIGTRLVPFAAAAQRDRVTTALCTTLVPALLGTGLRVVTYLPAPGFLMISMAGEAFFWIFSALGAYVVYERIAADKDNGVPATGWPDVTLALVTFIVVRVTLAGITFDPN